MNKMQMAHDFAMKLTGNNETPIKTLEGIVEMAWKYADAMQAEADKRITEVRIDNVSEAHANALREACEKEWHPPWSVAPPCAQTWSMSRSGRATWTLYDYKGEFLQAVAAPSFNYQGNWQDSLRKRPK